MAFNDLYKQSIYFEIYSTNQSGEAQTLKESFAFTIPPSSIDIIQPQRITKTPTPGGYFVDNYGLDGAQISINGETGNDESRLTVLGPGKAPRYISGQDAFFEFRNRIVRYSDKSEDYVMHFYDLTHKGAVNIFSARAQARRLQYKTEAWEVVLDDFASRRNSAKPFFYPYSINLTGVRSLGEFNPRLARTGLGALSEIRNTIDDVSNAVSAFTANVDNFLSDNFEYLTEMTDILSAANGFMDQLTSFTGLFTEYEQKLEGLFDDVISQSSEFLTSGIQLISFPYDVLDTAKTELADFSSKTIEFLLKASNEGKAVIDKYDWEKTIDPVSELSQSLIDVQTPFNEMMLTAKQGASYEPIGAVAISGVVSPVYGFSPYIVQGNTRLDRVARDTFGDPDMKDVISSINNVYANDELISGTVLKLPILEPRTRFSNNAVYNTPSERDDLLGRDAMINDDGVFVTDPSDYALTANEDTVLQAVSHRLAEKKGRQIRNGSFGVVSQIGAALSIDSTFEYLNVSLVETLIQDPRITDVYSLNFSVNGDKIYQEFKFDTITKKAVEYKEGL